MTNSVDLIAGQAMATNHRLIARIVHGDIEAPYLHLIRTGDGWKMAEAQWLLR